jgi:hypothetical protein
MVALPSRVVAAPLERVRECAALLLRMFIDRSAVSGFLPHRLAVSLLDTQHRY